MKVKKTPSHKAVKAPEGYHWVSDKGRYYLSEGKGEAEAKFRLKRVG